MRQTEGTAKIPSIVRGRGTLAKAGVERDVVFSLTRDKYAHADPWQLEAVSIDPQGSIQDVVGAGALNEAVVLRGTVNRGFRRVFIPKVPWWRAEGEVLRSDVWGFEMDDGELDFVPKQWRATVHITRNPLALHEAARVRDPRGYCEEAAPRTEPVSWQSELGSVEFSSWLAFEDVQVGDASAGIEIPYPSVRFVIPYQDGMPHDAVLDRIETWLASFLRFVGFLGRIRTMWTKIGLLAHESEPSGWYEAKRYRMAGDRTRSEEFYPLLAPRKFVDAIADGLYTRFVQHPARRQIETCIDILTTSREKAVRFGFHKFISAFMAFEIIVGAYQEVVGHSSTLRGAERKRFLRFVRSAIREFSSVEGLSPEIVDTLVRKVPDLVRPSFADRAMVCLHGLNIRTEDLFLPDTNIEEAIRDIANRRNALVHAGREVSIKDAYADEWRLRLLTERIVYSWIGGKKEWLSPHEGRENRWLAEPLPA